VTRIGRTATSARAASRPGAATIAASSIAAGSSWIAAVRAPARAAALHQQPIADDEPHLHEAQDDDEHERQDERELHGRRAAIGRALARVRRQAAFASPITVSMMLSKNAGSLPDERAQAMRTTAIAAAARITRAYSAVVCPSSRRSDVSHGPRAIAGSTSLHLLSADGPDGGEQHGNHREEEEGGQDQEHERERAS
jgi:hypothetical protein